MSQTPIKTFHRLPISLKNLNFLSRPTSLISSHVFFYLPYSSCITEFTEHTESPHFRASHLPHNIYHSFTWSAFAFLIIQVLAQHLPWSSWLMGPPSHAHTTAVFSWYNTSLLSYLYLVLMDCLSSSARGTFLTKMSLYVSFTTAWRRWHATRGHWALELQSI